MRKLVVIAAVVACTTTGVRASPDDALSLRVSRLTDWVAAVRAHEPGTADAPFTRIADWNNAAIEQLWLDAQTLFHFVRCDGCGPPSVIGLDGRRVGISYNKAELFVLRKLATTIRERPGDHDDLLKRAAILHADIVMLADPQGEIHVAPPMPAPGQKWTAGTRSPAPERVVLKGNDGRQESLRNGVVHWDIAYVLLDRVGNDGRKPAPQNDETVRLWYRATIAHLQAVAMHDAGHFNRALRLFPTDADILFQAACLHEALASPPVQEVVRTAALPTGVDIGVKSEHSELESAERLFRQALEQRPAFLEARLRWGRVLARLGRHADAAAELRKVSPQDLDSPENEYYAALFLGAEEEALGRRDDARAAYTRAAELFPLAQSPYIALSHLARDSGDRADVQKGIDRVVALPDETDHRRDPYWVYHFYQGRDLDALLDRLYQPFRHRKAR